MKNRLLLGVVAIVETLLLVAAVHAQDNSSQPFLGITFGSADTGAVVTSVVPNSAAADAGLQRNDIITAVNGDKATADTLADMVKSHAVGDTITLDVLRNNQTLNLDVTLQAQPTQMPLPQIRSRIVPRNGTYLGVTLNSADNGAVVTAVEAGSPAETAGLQVDDVITAINGKSVSSPADASAAIQGMNSGDSVTVSILRNGDTMDIQATLGSRNFGFEGGNFLGRMMDNALIYDGQNWRIISLSDSSPLAKAGLQNGDVITAIDGESRDPQSLNTYLNGLADDAQVSLTVDRNGKSTDVTVSAADLKAANIFGGRLGGLGEMPFFNGRGRGPLQFNFPPFFNNGGTQLGVEFITLNADLAAQHHVDVTDGALITNVADNSPAAEAGLKVNDVVTAVDGDKLDSERTLRDRMLAYEPGDVVTLDILRNGESMSLDVTVGGFEPSMPQFFFGPGNNGRTQPQPPAAIPAPQATQPNV